MAKLRALLVLGRVSNLPTVWSNVVAAWFLAEGTWDWPLLWAAIGGSLIYVGGMVQNDLMDAEWDAKHGKNRPIARGEIGIRAAALFFAFCMGAGIAILVSAGAGFGWVIGLFGVITLYNRLHKRWAGAMWIMGACRALLFLSAASIFEPTPGREVWMWAGALLVYVAGITLAARGEDTGEAVKKLATVLLACPLILAVWVLIRAGNPFLLGAAILFVHWLVFAFRNLRAQPPKIGKFVGWLLAGMVLIDAMAAATISPSAAMLCAGLLPLNLLLQRYVPAT